MTRYLRQRDRYSCGPHVLVNAMKFQGDSLAERKRNDLAAWKDYCGCGVLCGYQGSRNGTNVKVLSRYCEQLGYRRLWAPNMRKMDLALRRGHAIIVQVRWKPDHGHFFLVTKRRPKFFQCVNLYRGETIGWLSKRRFHREHRKNVLEFRAWIVPKAN